MGEITQAKTILDTGLSLDKEEERLIALRQRFGHSNKALNARAKHLFFF